jgi:putative membrane protein
MRLKARRRETATIAIILSVVSLAIHNPLRAAENSQNRGQLSAADYKFAKEAAQGGMMEVTLGKFAVHKAGEDAVKQFGQRMVDDHGKAGKQLEQIASQKGAMLPNEPTKEQTKKIDHLTKLSGREFDRAYISLMVKDHKDDLKEFQHAAEKSQDSELKSFAAATAAMIKEHLRMAQAIEESFRTSYSQTK